MAAVPYVSLLAAAVSLAMFGTSRDAESYSARAEGTPTAVISAAAAITELTPVGEWSG
jgi:hypothetical protein